MRICGSLLYTPVRLLAVLTVLVAGVLWADELVTQESLLARMADRDAVTYFTPDERVRLWSSTDRASVAADRAGWFAFDGRKTVSVPHGKFFGCDPLAVNPFAMRFAAAHEDGLLESFWVMPFATSCTMMLRNVSDQPIVISRSEIVRGDYRWDDARSLRFDLEMWHWGDTFVDYDSVVFAYLRQ